MVVHVEHLGQLPSHWLRSGVSNGKQGLEHIQACDEKEAGATFIFNLRQSRQACIASVRLGPTPGDRASSLEDVLRDAEGRFLEVAGLSGRKAISSLAPYPKMQLSSFGMQLRTVGGADSIVWADGCVKLYPIVIYGICKTQPKIG